MNNTETALLLPNDVISPTDIYRLIRELEMLDDFFRQSAIREGGSPQAPPRYSRLLDSVVTVNGMNLLDTNHRQTLLQLLQGIAEHSPVLHMSFSVDPPGAYVQKIVAWLRENLQPNILLRVGLQPNIGAGCVVRTTNHAYDFSLRKYFDSKREYFGKKLHDAVAAQHQGFPDDLDPSILSQAPINDVDVAHAEVPQATSQPNQTGQPHAQQLAEPQSVPEIKKVEVQEAQEVGTAS